MWDGNCWWLEAVFNGCRDNPGFVSPDVRLSPDLTLRWLLQLLRLHRYRRFPGIRVKSCLGLVVSVSRKN